MKAQLAGEKYENSFEYSTHYYKIKAASVWSCYHATPIETLRIKQRRGFKSAMAGENVDYDIKPARRWSRHILMARKLPFDCLASELSAYASVIIDLENMMKYNDIRCVYEANHYILRQYRGVLALKITHRNVWLLWKYAFSSSRKIVYHCQRHQMWQRIAVTDGARQLSQSAGGTSAAGASRAWLRGGESAHTGSSTLSTASGKLRRWAANTKWRYWCRDGVTHCRAGGVLALLK